MKDITLRILFVLFAIIQAHATNNDSYKWLHAKSFNGMNATALTVDGNNNTYFYGFSYSDVKYGSNTTSIDFATERNAIVVVKVNDQNVYQWTKKIKVGLGESSQFNVRSMDVDDDGNMYFGGDLGGSITVKSQTYNINVYGYFIMKTDAEGNILWFKAGNLSHGSVHRLKYTAGRIAFLSAWTPNPEVKELFGTDLMAKFGSLSHFNECDMMVGALSVTDGEIVFAHGIKTGQNLMFQWDNAGITVNNRNVLDADKSGNIYVAGGFFSNILRVAGVNYNIASGMEAAESQFVLCVGKFGETSWVRIITNASGKYPTLAVNNSTGVAVLFNGVANNLKIGEESIVVQGDASKYNHLALFDFNGDLKYKKTIPAKTTQITNGPNGSFCVAGNLTADGQYFGIDGLYNGESTQENLFVGFYDRTLNTIAGQSVISNGKYMPVSIKTGADGKIRLLGLVGFESESNNITFPFGEYTVPRPEGDNGYAYSVLDPKPTIKAQIMTYGIGCGRYSININPSIKSKVQWYVNNVAKGTDFSLKGDDQTSGYTFGAGVSYIKAMLTDSTDASNTAEFMDTVTVYNPVVNINTQINPLTGEVKYAVVVSNFAPTYNLYVDRGNYDGNTESSGTYNYSPGTHTIKVTLSEMSNMNCHFQFEKTFEVPDPKSIIGDVCNQCVIKGMVESAIANFLAGEVRVDLYGLASNGVHIPLKSDTIDANGEFKFENLQVGDYKVRANIIDPSKYPAIMVTYFNNIMNQVTSWQNATPIALSCNQWADLNLTLAAINELLSGTGSISGIISYSNGGAQDARAMVKASAQVGDVVVSNAPVMLRKKSTGEIVARTTTDANGLFYFENLPEAEYEIVVDIPGVAMQSTYDVTVSAQNNEIENRNFLLTQSGIVTTNQYAIVATASEGGVISNAGAKMLNAGEGLSYTITPSNGQFIDDVLVNGQSVGVVSTYNFSNVNSNQTIHAIFKLITSKSELFKSELKVYPVVFDKKITIAGLEERSEIRITNQVGALCHVFYNGSEAMHEFEASKLSQGVYFVQVADNNGVRKTFKILKK